MFFIHFKNNNWESVYNSCHKLINFFLSFIRRKVHPKHTDSHSIRQIFFLLLKRKNSFPKPSYGDFIWFFEAALIIFNLENIKIAQYYYNYYTNIPNTYAHFFFERKTINFLQKNWKWTLFRRYKYIFFEVKKNKIW